MQLPVSISERMKDCTKLTLTRILYSYVCHSESTKSCVGERERRGEYRRLNDADQRSDRVEDAYVNKQAHEVKRSVRVEKEK